jgi:hypothetical protein
VDVVSYDLIADEIVSPSSFCEFTENETIRVKLTNKGYDTLEAGQKISIGYQLEGSSQSGVEEFVLNSSWPANTSRQFEFKQGVDLTGKSRFYLNAYVATRNAVDGNDGMQKQIDLTARPVVDLGGDIYTNKIDTVILNAGAGFAAYLWQDGKSQQYYNVTNFGWKWVFVTDEYGCVASDTIFVGSINQVPGILPVATRIYPNPSKGQVFVVMENIPASGVYVDLTDIEGRLVMREKVLPSPDFRHTLELNGLSPGVYLLNISASAARRTHRIVITP